MAKATKPPRNQPVRAAAPAPVPANGATGLLSLLGRLSAAGFALLCLALVLAPLAGGFPSGAAYGADPVLFGIRLLVLASGLIAVLAPACMAAGARADTGVGTRAALLALWLTFALTLLSLLVRSRFFTSPVLLFAQLPAALDWLCYALAATLAARLARTTPRAASTLTGALTLAGGDVAASVARDYGENAAVLGRTWRAQGVFFDPNFAAGFLALCLPLGAALCLAARERLVALVLGVGTALMAGALVATGSRAGVGAAGAGLIVAFLLALAGHVRLPWPRVGAALVAVALLGFVFRAPLLGRVGGDAGAGQEHSGDFRAWTWRGTARMTNEHPLLGTGPGTFEFVYPRYALVAKTNLAHSSYRQLAAEQGWPALAAACLAILLAVAAGARSVLRQGGAQTDDFANARRLLLCALVGSVVAGAARSYFDSEWSVLGNALAFWAVAGLAAGFAAAAPEGTEPFHAPPRARIGVAASAAGFFVAFVLALLLFNNAVRLTGLLSSPAPSLDAARAAAGAWPPDPNALAFYGRFLAAAQPEDAARFFEQAARVEPSGARFFRLGRVYEQQNRPREAVAAFERAAGADPTALQTWRALAEARANFGDAAGALAAWQQLVALHEGPVGRVRAIPEQTETYPAFAYAALADQAARLNEAIKAADDYERAARVVERYADTVPVYQMLEIAAARQQRTNLAARRRELRDLYARVCAERLHLPPLTTDAAGRRELAGRRGATLARLDRMIAEAGGG